MERFSELKYQRPDGSMLLAAIDKAVTAFESSESYETAKNIFQTLTGQQEHFGTMKELAFIRNSIDTSDAFYEIEMEYFHHIEPKIQVEMKKFHEVFLKSPFLKDFEKELGSLYM